MKPIQHFGRQLFLLAISFVVLQPSIVTAQVQFFQTGNSLFVFGGANDDNVGFSNWNGDDTEFRIFDYVTSPATPYYFSGVENLFFVLGDGENRVQTASTTVNIIVGDFEIQNGTGYDRALLSGIMVGGNAQIDLGDGDSVIEIGNTVFSKNLTIDTGNGNDLINWGGTGWDVAYGTVHGNMTVNLGTDSVFDSIRLTSFKCDGHLEINGQGGSDFITVTGSTNYPGIIGPLTITGGWGQDSITVEDAIINGDLSIDSGNGADSVNVRANYSSWVNAYSAMHVKGRADISTGYHADDLSLFHAKIEGQTRIDTGPGNDVTELVNCRIYSHFNLNMGNGNDDLLLQSTSVQSCYLHGNNGVDTGDQFSSTLGSPQTIQGFESGNIQ